MDSAGLLIDGFGRIRDAVHGAVRDLDAEALNYRPDAESNSIAWLVWHLTRVQDDHVSDVAEAEQAWEADGWFDRFGLSLPPGDTGFGHTGADVAEVMVTSPDLLSAYHDAVHGNTVAFLEDLSEGELDVVVDEAWNPPVTLGVRLVSVLADDLQHAGQAEYLRGLVLRR